MKEEERKETRNTNSSSSNQARRANSSRSDRSRRRSKGSGGSTSANKPVEVVDTASSKSGKGREDIPPKNDWAFYAASEQIAKDVASIPFNYMGGTDFPVEATVKQVQLQNEVPVIHSYFTTKQPIVSVLTIFYLTSIGVCTKRTDGANMAAVQLYTWVRHMNSGAKNYEAADLMMYVLAMRDIYAGFSEAKRILGTVTYYDYYNHNMPDTLLDAAGVDANDLRSHVAQYRGRLNLIAKKINSFAVPKYFKMFDRAAYFAGVLFTDSTSKRSQFYQTRRYGYYTWNPIRSETGTSLVFTRTIDDGSAKKPFSHYLDILENQLDAMFLDEDALTMSGDIMKAFQSELYQVADTPENYVAPIVYDEDILGQIENSHTYRQFNAEINVGTELDITQNNQLITFAPYKEQEFDVPAKVKRYYDLSTFAFNSHKDEPDYRDVLEWSRLITTQENRIVPKSTTDPAQKNKYILQNRLTSCGLEIVWDYRISDSTGYSETVITKYYDFDLLEDTLEKRRRYARLFAKLSQFDWHPIIYLSFVTKTGETLAEEEAVVEMIGDLKVATTMSDDTAKAINEAAVYGAIYASNKYQA